MRLTSLAAVFALSAVVAACASVGPGMASSRSGDLEVEGASTKNWARGDSSLPLNFTLVYETRAWQGKAARPFHHMKTELSLTYDPKKGEVRNARLTSTEPGEGYRNLCVAPMGSVLRVRITTYFHGPEQSLTVLDLNRTQPSLTACADVGVGPDDGLVESFDVLFKKDGTYRVTPQTKAYLAGAGLRVVRRMNETPDLSRLTSANYP